ncbi:NAD(P)/FAD-dependent oxidoreductase [Nonomuraea sp. NPDC048916]|uniref:NAD(P)/FAD-dependent oxidoreductase n=1 Tax=Nonomuraea sp. NPDC048916 TaxID=3154232 RepID=UPI0033CF332F
MVQQTRPVRPRVVIVGAGFAGLNAMQELARGGAQVTLVDRNPYTTFQPLLYQVATGALSAGDVTYPLRVCAAKYPDVRVRVAGMVDLRAADRKVRLDDGTTLDYDYLVLATGVTTNWASIPGAEANSMPIYSADDAVVMRGELQRRLEEAAEGRRPTSHVVVIGGGATGVEMAGAMAELRRRSIPLTYPEIGPDQSSVTLVERFDHVLSPYRPRLRAKAARALRRRGVRMMLGSTVASVEPDAVVLADGTRLPSDVTVWALGVAAPEGVGRYGLRQGRGGGIVVTQALNVEEHPEIFVAGDLAAPPKPLPQLAQPGIQMGRHVGRQILAAARGRPLKPFVYHDRGTMATVGRCEAVLQLDNGLTLSGLPAWLCWIGVHVAQLLGGRNRITVLVNFLWRYFGPRRSAASVTK